MKKISLLLLLVLGARNLLTAQMVLPPNMYADSVNAPFYYGVSSGDPTSHSVIIWTCISPPSIDSISIQVGWQLASDMRFTHVVKSGISRTDTASSFTIKIDVDGLSPGATYYYRFVDNEGKTSAWGRTKTLPVGPLERTKIAVMSCSSIYSGYFNAYRRIAERSDLQLILHLGDFIYDFVDVDEQVRVPTPYPTEPVSKAEWTERYRYYLLDPDLREARRMQTWVAIWDNHDLNGQDTLPMQAYREWLPIRETPSVQQNLLYRSFSLGDLVDIEMADANTRQEIDSFPDGEANMLDHTQFDWLTTRLKSSTAKWHLITSQKMAGGWYTHGIDPGLLSLVPNDSNVFDASSWDGFMETRNRLFDTIATHDINNCMIVSGDAHITMAMDLVKDPYDSIHYNPITGFGAVGTEFLPTSISRGNFDEAGLSIDASAFIIDLSRKANPHHQLTEINSHGYGILEINADSIRATPFYSDILHLSSTETKGQQLVMLNGENHWKRDMFTNILDEQALTIKLLPNPVNQTLNIQLNMPLQTSLEVRLSDLYGRVLKSFLISASGSIQTSDIANGTYIFDLFSNGRLVHSHKIIIQH